MNILRASGLAILLAVTGFGLAQSAKAPVWRRVTVPQTGISLELPSDLKTESSQEVKESSDWVKKVIDYSFVDNDLFASVTVFEGAPSTKVTGEFLKTVIADFLKGVEGKDAKAQALKKDETPIDGAPAVRTNYRVGKDKADQFFMQTAFVGTETRVVSVVLVYFNEKSSAATRAQRIVASLKVKRA